MISLTQFILEATEDYSNPNIKARQDESKYMQIIDMITSDPDFKDSKKMTFTDFPKTVWSLIFDMNGNYKGTVESNIRKERKVVDSDVLSYSPDLDDEGKRKYDYWGPVFTFNKKDQINVHNDGRTVSIEHLATFKKAYRKIIVTITNKDNEDIVKRVIADNYEILATDTPKDKNPLSKSDRDAIKDFFDNNVLNYEIKKGKEEDGPMAIYFKDGGHITISRPARFGGAYCITRYRVVPKYAKPVDYPNYSSRFDSKGRPVLKTIDDVISALEKNMVDTGKWAKEVGAKLYVDNA